MDPGVALIQIIWERGGRGPLAFVGLGLGEESRSCLTGVVWMANLISVPITLFVSSCSHHYAGQVQP